MLKKKSMVAGLLLSSALFISACSGNQAANTKTEEKAVAAAPVSNTLMVTADTVTELGGCVLASRYTAGDKLIFRVNALDPNTNEQVKDAKVQIKLSTGETIDAKYGHHGDDDFWVASYKVTEDTPTGQLDYEVLAEDGERKGDFKPFNVKMSLINIVAPEAANGEAPAPAK